MKKLSQKQAVVDAVLMQLPNFQKYSDNALVSLLPEQLEQIKTSICVGIQNGDIEYSKDITNYSEVRSYARSMVMNHMKKARELNGGYSYTGNTASGGDESSKMVRVQEKTGPKGVDLDILPEDLKAFAKTLI